MNAIDTQLKPEPRLSPGSRGAHASLAEAHFAQIRPLRVLMVVEASAGGTGRHVLDLSEGLINQGCEVHLSYSPGRADRLFLDRLNDVKGLRHAAVPMRTSIHPSDFSVVRAVRRYLRTCGGFDVVHGHSSKGGAIARLAAVGTGASAFYTLHGLIMMDPGMPRWKKLFYRGIEVGLSLRTTGIIAVSPEEQRAAVRLGLGRSRVALVPNGVGPAELAPRPAARRTIGAADDELVFGFVGRLVNQKAPHVLVGAFAVTAREVPQARLAVVGAGPLESSLRESARRLGVEEKIYWLGERDARGVLAGFDVFAMSSRKEGMPYVVLEAMAAGLPVVATDSAGVESLIDSGVQGVVVPCDDIAAFAGAMIALSREPARRARYGRAARERVAQFTVDAMVDRTLGAYRGCLGPVAGADLPPDGAPARPPRRPDLPGSGRERPWRPERDQAGAANPATPGASAATTSGSGIR